MHKRILILLAVLSFTLPLTAQQKKQEVIYLKNGSMIRNIQELQHVDTLIRVRAADGSVFVFGPGELAKMDYEPRQHIYKESGYLLNVELGILSGRESMRNNFGITRQTSTAPSFSVVNGYRFNRFAGVGIGLGVDGYREVVITPLFMRGTGYLFRGRFSPVYALDAGYGFYSPVFNGRQNGAFEFKFRGGLMGNAAGGIQVFLGQDVSFYIMLGYHLQDARFEYSSERLESREIERILFRRMSLRMGFSF
jgi:hypothetical protein